MIGPLPGFSTRIVWIVAALLGVQRPARTGDADVVRDLIQDGRYARAAEDARAKLADLGPCAPERIQLECLCAEGLRRGDDRLAPSTLALAEDATALAAELYGTDDARTAEPLLQLGALRCIRRDWPGAKQALERARELFHEASAGKDPRQAVASSYLAIATLFAEGDGERALAQLDGADRLLDRLEPGDSPDQAWILDMRGNVLAALGRAEEALAAYSSALEMRRRTQRGEHPLLAITLLNVGTMQDKEGRLVEARASYEEVMALIEGGAEISRTSADAGMKLGSIWEQLDETERAQSCFESVRANLEVRKQQQTADYASVLYSLARLAYSRKGFDRAREILREELATLDVAEDAPAGSRAHALVLLALIEVDTGRFDRADEQISIARALGGPELPGNLLAECNEVEAWIAYGRGELESAQILLRRVVEAPEVTRPGDRRAVARAYDLLARVSLLRGDLGAAIDESLQAEAWAREEWARSALGLEELSSIGLEESASLRGNLCAALCAAVRSPRPDAVERVWNALLLSGDIVYRECAERYELVRASTDPGLAKAAAKLAEARLRLSGLYVRSRRSGDAQGFEEAISRARSEREAAERELAAKERAVGARRAAVPDLATLRVSLDPGAALVRFCRAARPPGDREHATDWAVWIPCYYALVLAPDEGVPRVVELGPAKEIEDLVERLRRAIRTGTALRDYMALAAKLRHCVLDPLLPSLAGARLVNLVLDGELHLVPFEALCSDSGEFLAESGPAFHCLATEAELRASRGCGPSGSGLLALGDPDFAAATEDDSPTIAREFRGEPTLSCATRSGPSLAAWPPLPETRAEVEGVAVSWKSGQFAQEKVELLEGAAATERALRRRGPGHRVIHIATHGFYEDARGLGSGDGGRGVSTVPAGDAISAIKSRTDQLPFLRSGLVFAGAGAAGPRVDPENDGILTTEEVLGLDLSGVEWVVLSACDTGIGEIRSVEGVLGLRRAFRMAGVRTVIASLWPVEDRWAREWMDALYRARFVDRRSTAEAVRAASLAVLAKLRGQGLEPLPRLWASFVAVGESH